MDVDEHHPFSTPKVADINMIFHSVIVDVSKVHIQLKKYCFCNHGTNTDEIRSNDHISFIYHPRPIKLVTYCPGYTNLLIA